MKLGGYVLGVAAIATGIVNLVFGAFDPAEEPIQAWVDNVPHGLFPDAVAILLTIGGAAIVLARAVRWGAVVLAICYLLFALFWMPRFYWAPHYLGWPHAIDAAAGAGQNLIVAAAAAILYVSTTPHSSSRLESLVEISRWTFGLSTVAFGLGHFAAIGPVAAMVPRWMPLGGNLWAIVTGTAFVLAGIAILCGILDVLATRLLALMLLIFSVFALSPQIYTYPRDHAAWGVNVYNLAAVGAALILAEWLAGRRRELRLKERRAPSTG